MELNLSQLLRLRGGVRVVAGLTMQGRMHLWTLAWSETCCSDDFAAMGRVNTQVCHQIAPCLIISDEVFSHLHLRVVCSALAICGEGRKGMDWCAVMQCRAVTIESCAVVFGAVQALITLHQALDGFQRMPVLLDTATGLALRGFSPDASGEVLVGGCLVALAELYCLPCSCTKPRLRVWWNVLSGVPKQTPSGKLPT